MWKFIRYYNQNRKGILLIIAVIAFGFFILQFFNHRAAGNTRYVNGNTTVTENQNIVTGQNTDKSNVNTESAITGEKGSKTYDRETDTIEQFIQYCNEGKTENAYNMLTSECKENMYPKLEYFIENYYNINFKESKSYNIQRWSSSIYKIDLKGNMLQTGNLTSSSKQDYITVVHKEDEYKLNINNYIGRTDLNKEKDIDNISIKVLYKETYMNYETYTLEVQNNNDTDIYLDNLENTNTIYLLDENNIKHTAYIHEIDTEQLHVNAYAKTQIQIKFSNKYIAGRKYSQIVFENLIIDKEQDESKKISINLEW